MSNAREMAVRSAMKDAIERLIEECDGSITAAAKRVGTSHQNLRNWQDMEVKASDVRKFLDVAEKIFDIIGVPPSKRWKALRGEK